MPSKKHLLLATAAVVAMALVVFPLLFWPERKNSDDPPAKQWFVDATLNWGLDFVHDAGPTGQYFLPQIIGSGAAAIDFDQDGLLDLLLLQNGGPTGERNRLYRQFPAGRFQDVSAGSGLDFAGHNMGVAVGDIDNDGFPDIVVTQLAGIKLLRNDTRGKFTDVTDESGLGNRWWGTAACFVDFDQDGWLDLFVVNYVDFDPATKCSGAGNKPSFCHPNNYPGSPARLFRNRTAAGTGKIRFEDVSDASGISRLRGRGLGAVAHDFDGDGRPDLFVANDAQANFLWMNQGNGTFVEEGVLRGVALNGLGQAQGNMGIAFGDVDRDGRPDLFVTHLTEETHTYWRQVGRGQFHDETARVGLASSRWRGTGFGTVFGDFDCDGRLDVALVNGRVSAAQPGPEFAWADYAQRNQLFAQAVDGRFQDVSPINAVFCAAAGVFRGLVVADFDNDGALDLLVTQVAGRTKLFRNVAAPRGHWLMVRATDPKRRRDAYGAEVRVRTGKQTWTAFVNPGHSYLASNDPRVHFGLGALDAFDSIEVVWPDGSHELFSGGAADRELTLVQGAGNK